MQHPGPLLRVRLPRRPRRHRRLRLLRLRRPARPVPALRPRPDLLFRRHRHHLLRHGVQERAFGRGDGGRVPGLLLAFALLCPCRFHRGVHLLLVVREQRRGTRVRPLRVLIRSRGPLRCPARCAKRQQQRIAVGKALDPYGRLARCPNGL
ncbi:hypothetical protein DFJ74DRAFT_654533 [Hyaloraphidium curvatum]|nr:hypothetical protein DFJ74DRAFT_654533 [Hyaloraphidium curvatum]